MLFFMRHWKRIKLCDKRAFSKLFIWPAMKNELFSLPKNIKNMIYGHVKK